MGGWPEGWVGGRYVRYGWPEGWVGGRYVRYGRVGGWAGGQMDEWVVGRERR
jgi:hypothetical protein